MSKLNLPFKPFNDAHAIVEAAIFIEFHKEFSISEMQQLQKLKDEFSDFFNFNEDIKMTNLVFDGNTMLPNVYDGGQPFELKIINPSNNKLLWLMRIMPNVISIHCLDYTRWCDIYTITMKYLNLSYLKLDGSKQKLKSIGLKYIDQFIYTGKIEDYNIKQLIDENSIFLSKNSLNSSHAWHVHSGWFEENENMSMLNILNLTTQNTPINSEKILVTSIDHTIIRNFIDAEVLDVSGLQIYENLLSNMHKSNKKILRNILVEDMNKRIKLNEGD